MMSGFFRGVLQHGRSMALASLMLLGLLYAGAAGAHSSSNSYLVLSMPSGQLTLRADVHLRDLDLVFDLDGNRDGQVTWGETRSRSAELSAWLSQGIGLSASGQSCSLGDVDLQASFKFSDTIFVKFNSIRCSACHTYTQI